MNVIKNRHDFNLISIIARYCASLSSLGAAVETAAFSGGLFVSGVNLSLKCNSFENHISHKGDACTVGL